MNSHEQTHTQICICLYTTHIFSATSHMTDISHTKPNVQPVFYWDLCPAGTYPPKVEAPSCIAVRWISVVCTCDHEYALLCNYIDVYVVPLFEHAHTYAIFYLVPGVCFLWRYTHLHTCPLSIPFSFSHLKSHSIHPTHASPIHCHVSWLFLSRELTCPKCNSVNLASLPSRELPRAHHVHPGSLRLTLQIILAWTMWVCICVYALPVSLSAYLQP